MKRLKLYTDLDLLKIGGIPVELVIPFRGDDPREAISVTRGRFEKLDKTGKDFLELSSIEDCDAAFLPLQYVQGKERGKFEESIREFTEKIEKSGKKIFVFLSSDTSLSTVNFKNALVFCNSLYQSKRESNEYGYVFFFEDFVERYYNNQLIVRNKTNIPTIGFCGYAPPLSQKFGKVKIISIARLILNYLSYYKYFPAKSSHSYRVRALLAVLRSKIVKSNFLIRSNFGFSGPNYWFLEEQREAYVENIIQSDYILCVRGYGNNSIRFFEALCCGRIPVFVNTDCVLPFDFEINWKDYCVWVEENEISKIPEKVLEFHNKLSNDDFKDLQIKIRAIWEEYFKPETFFSKLHLFLEDSQKDDG